MEDLVAPNRYRIPAFHEVHGWDWEQNPNGMFKDGNFRMSCNDYTMNAVKDASAHISTHGYYVLSG